jgi:hypothetical protein
MPGQHTKNPEASENPAGGAGAATAATAPLLAEAAASTDKNKAAHARAAASRTKNPEEAASRTKNPEGGNGAGPNEKAIEESSVLPPARKKLASAVGKVADSRKNLADAVGKAAAAPAAPAQLLCPQCGYHIGALQVTSTAPAPAPG